jgi:hypothetical protein
MKSSRMRWVGGIIWHERGRIEMYAEKKKKNQKERDHMDNDLG